MLTVAAWGRMTRLQTLTAGANAMPQSPPQSIPADLLIDALRQCGCTTVVTVPDTHQRTLMSAIAAGDQFRMITCATEDEATTIAAGLWIGGDEPVLLIQHAGIYASVNTMRGVAMDGHIPLFYLVGLLQREPDRAPRDSNHSMVKYCEPLLDTFGVPHELIDGPDDVPRIPELFRLSRERRGPAAALIGLPTA
ncbi:MAG: thiamine pyrophosphate-binding protein [Dehalococcoidia bacterium]